MPQAERRFPIYLQIAGHYKREILEGRLREGDRLPSVREIHRRWTSAPGAEQFGQNVVQRAVAHLRDAEHLVRTDGTGTYVAAQRAALGPQQRLRLSAAPLSEVTEVTAAELVPAPLYIVPILGLAGANGERPVIRRETVARLADGTPHMLSVSWTAPWYAPAVPELLVTAPLPDPRGAAHLIAARTGRQVDWGRQGMEARLARDDGRELVHLGLRPGAFVLAGVWTWVSGDEVLEYGEYVLPAGQVIESDMEA